MGGNLSSDGVTMKILVGGNLKTKRNSKKETRSKKTILHWLLHWKIRPHLPVRNQAGVEKYTAGTNSSPEHPSGSENQEKHNLGPLDSPSPKKKQKPKRSKWTREEYKQVISL